MDLNQISDHLSILQTLYKFTHAQDRLDLATMSNLLIPNQTIKFDLTKHFPEMGSLQGTATEISNILYEASAGWTATQHPVYNPLVTFSRDDPNRAQVQAMVQAYHSLETEPGNVESLTVRATWYVDMQRIDGHDDKNTTQWVITGMAMERDVPIANVGLFAKMRERMADGKKRKAVDSLHT